MKLLIGLFLLFLVSVAAAQNVAPPKVDKRVEITGIVFRLADAPEYNFENYKDYTDAIHNHFDAYKNHRVVNLARKLRQSGAGYSYVANFALHMEDVPQFKLAAPMNKNDAAKFGNEKNINEFLAALKDFYKVSKFEDFWTANQARYALAEKNFEKLSNEFHPEWYEEFYGQKFNGQFKIVIGMSNGNNFYGSTIEFPDKSKTVYAVFAPLIDEGNPRLPANALAFTAHEFNHSFANPLIDKYAEKFEPSAKKLFQKVEKEMTDAAYGTWQIMMYESLVRAATNRYLMKYNRRLVAGNRQSDLFKQNFLWVDAFSDLLNSYENDRKNYANLETFLPQIIEFFERAARTDLNDFRKEFEAKTAKVEKIEPFANGANTVDPNLSELRIVFDKLLDDKGISILTSNDKNEQFPEVVGGRAGIAFANGNREFTLKIKLKPNTKYGFTMSGDGFQTADGYPLKDYKISFETK